MPITILFCPTIFKYLSNLLTNSTVYSTIYTVYSTYTTTVIALFYLL